MQQSVLTVDVETLHVIVDIADYLEKQFLPATIREAEERYRKIKQDVAKKGGGDAHDASGMNIAQNAKALEGSKTEIVNAKTNEVKVTNKGGQFTATIKILPPTNKKQHRVALVDSIDGNLLWEPSIVNGEHAVSINRNHDFYTKVYGPNIENADLIQGLDSLLWGLAEAEMSTFNDFTREQYEEMRNQVSHILKKLVKDLDDPESDD